MTIIHLLPCIIHSLRRILANASVVGTCLQPKQKWAHLIPVSSVIADLVNSIIVHIPVTAFAWTVLLLRIVGPYTGPMVILSYSGCSASNCVTTDSLNILPSLLFA